MTTDISIYVANLAKYNAGVLHGEWIELPASDVWDRVREILGDDEEWAIHDYEAPFAISEYADIDQLNEIAEELTDKYDMARFVYLVDAGYDYGYALEHYEEVTFYQGMSLEDVAVEMVEEGIFGTIADSIRHYIDYEAIGRDLGFDGYVETDLGVFCYY